MDRDELAQLLSNVTGNRLSPEQAKKVMAEAEENLKRLRQCIPPHTFELLPVDPDRKWDKHFKCSKCGGTITNREHYWYEKGLIHGGMKHG